MSRTIETEFECYACASMNHIHIRKPTPFEPVTSKHVCEVCESEFSISFKLVAGQKGKIAYGFLANGMKLTNEGKKLLKERNTQPIPVDENEEVQNGSNDQHAVSP